MLGRAGYLLMIGFIMFSGCYAQRQAVAADNDWAQHNGDSDETNFSPLAQINSGNAKDIGLAWFMDLPGEASLEGTPLEVGGIVYFTGSYSKVYAVEGASGKVIWTYDPELWKFNPGKMALNFAVNRGVAY